MSKLETFPLISASCRESAAITLCALSTVHQGHFAGLIRLLNDSLSMSDNASIYPALIHALKLLFLQIQKSKIDDKAVDHKRAIQCTLDILFSEDAVPYSTLLASFELLHILAKIPAGKVVLARQRQQAEANNPLTGETLDKHVQNGPTLAKEICKTLCERYLFAPPGSDRVFREDSGNSRVSIKAGFEIFKISLVRTGAVRCWLFKPLVHTGFFVQILLVPTGASIFWRCAPAKF